MEKTVLHVEGMACEHCVRAIIGAVGKLPGVAAVKVDLAAKTATVEYDSNECPLDRIKLEIEEQGYEVLA